MNLKRLPALLAVLALTVNLTACRQDEKPPQEPPTDPPEQNQPAEPIPSGIYYASLWMPKHRAELKKGVWQADDQGDLTLELTVSSPFAGGWALLTEDNTVIQQQDSGLDQGETQISITIPAQQAENQEFYWKLTPEQGEQEVFSIQLPQSRQAGQVYQLQDGRFVQPPLKKYIEVRSEVGLGYDLSQIEEISEDQLRSLSFDQGTIFPKTGMPENLTPEQLMEQAMDPGLGVRQLHQQGITGQGVSVAIIDQSIPEHHRTDHPEYAGKFEVYQSFTDQEYSMHGPAVASILVGESCGVAPGAKLYYVTANSWDGDAKFYADSLNWLIDLNQTLPEGEKIRVVSVSAAPGFKGGPFTQNNGLWEQARQRALAEGMLVLDVTEQSGIDLAPSYHSQPGTNQTPESLVAGFPGTPQAKLYAQKPRILCVPCSPRTTAGMWVNQGDSQYTYWGVGGLSWGIPYAAGVLALGWQLRPDLTPEQMLDLLLETAAKNDLGFPCINPPAFIEAVRTF